MLRKLKKLSSFSKIITMDNIIVRLIDLPHSVNGVTVLDEEGDYNVYINAKLSRDNRHKALNHELVHIKKSHFYTDKTVQECENEANI